MRHPFKLVIFTGATTLVAALVAFQFGAPIPKPAKRFVTDLYQSVADQKLPLLSEWQRQFSGRPEGVGQVNSAEDFRLAHPVRMPAIRGENNYGWVQLPHGTTVELVRDEGGSLVVRWDGNLVRIRRGSVAEGGVVVLQKTSARPFTG